VHEYIGGAWNAVENRPLGFSHEHVLVMEASAAKERPLEVRTREN
jgi:hypothetical protein